MKKSKFNLSHNASLTASMGKLIPFCTIDCLPNDSFRLSMDSFIRAQPMMAPLMHNVRFFAQWWFVPYRILWDNWTDFITGGEQGNQTPTFPTIKVKPETSSLADYFGLPVNNKELEVSALPFRAYSLIWNTRYRDEDLQNELPINFGDGKDTETNKELQFCAWAKDYFTTSRPWTQRGSQISVPVSSFADGSRLNYKLSIVSVTQLDFVYLNITFSKEFFSGFRGPSFEGTFTFNFSNSSGSVVSNESQYVSAGLNGAGDIFPCSIVVNYVLSASVTSESVTNATYTAQCSGLKGDGSNLVSKVVLESTSVLNSVNIRDLRLSSALQRYQERSLEYGNRYEEFIHREFGIKPRDSRIQRPEYLGGSKSMLQISEVLQTSEGENTGVGTMRGHGVSGLRQRPIRFRAPEHGIIIGILSIRPDSVYTQGLARQWTKFSKLDYFIPELANVGMQEVFQSEIYADGTNSQTLFGYVPRYEEYRKLPNRISGEFRKLLNYWNLAREFDAPPVLNSSFITMNPSKRIFAEQTQDSFLIMLRNNIRSYRVVPKRAKNILK